MTPNRRVAWQAHLIRNVARRDEYQENDCPLVQDDLPLSGNFKLRHYRIATHLRHRAAWLLHQRAVNVAPIFSRFCRIIVDSLSFFLFFLSRIHRIAC